MKKSIIGMIVSAITAILFWTANIIYGASVGFHTELIGNQNVIVVLLMIASYASTAIFGAFIGLFIIDKFDQIDS